MITTKAFKKLILEDNTVLFDIREKADFSDGFIPESIFFSFDEHLEWIKQSIEKNQSIIFIVDDSSKNRLETELQKRFPGVSIDYKVYSIASWKKEESPQDIVITIDPDELAMDIPHDDQLLMVDVRTEEEYNAEHITGAYHLPADQLTDPGVIAMLPEMANLYFYCNNGINSLHAASVFKNQGLHNVRVVMADWVDIKQQNGLSFKKTKPKVNHEEEGMSLS